MRSTCLRKGRFNGSCPLSKSDMIDLETQMPTFKPFTDSVLLSRLRDDCSSRAIPLSVIAFIETLIIIVSSTDVQRFGRHVTRKLPKAIVVGTNDVNTLSSSYQAIIQR